MNKLDSKGFSLVEVLIAAGMLGVISLGVMKISENQTEVQKKAEVNFEINSISNVISQNLLNGDACGYTLGVGNSIGSGTIIPEIKSRNNTVLFNLTTPYGNNQVKINSMILNNLVTSGTGPKYGDVSLQVTFEKTSKVIHGNKIVIKSFPLKLELDASNNLIKCYSATENAIFSAKVQSCASIKGVFNSATDMCDLSGYGTGVANSHNAAVSTQYLSEYDSQMLNPRFVNTTGDTMSGKLQVNNVIESNNSVCVSGKCRNFSVASCSVGQVVKRINTDGSVQCATVTCPDASTFFVGIDNTGNPICKAFPTNTCSANQYVSKVNADGSVVCADLPPGTNKNCTPGAIQRIDSVGNHYCVTIPADTNVYGKSCSAGYSLRGFDASGNPICDLLNAGGTLVNIYQCPKGTGGWNPGGAWGSYGCQGQYSSSPTCTNIEFPNTQHRNCTLIGKISIK